MSYLYIGLEQIMELACYLCGIYFYTKASLSKKVYLYIGVLIGFIIVLFSMGSIDISFYKAWVWTSAQLVSLIILLDEKMKKRLFYSIAAVITIDFLNIVITILFDSIYPLEMQVYDYTWNVTLILILGIGIIIKTRNLRKKILFSNIPGYIYSFILIIFLLLSALLMCNYIYGKEFNQREQNISIVVTFLCVAAVLVLVVLLFLIFYLLQQQKEKVEVLMKYEKMQKLYYKSVLSNNKNIRAFRHDINHHLKCIYGLVKEEQYSGAEEYLESVIGEFESVGKSKYKCDNYVIDAILNQMVALMEKEQIDFNFQYDIYGKVLIQDMDLSTILYNLLNNAIEECSKIEEGSREIYLQIKEHNENVIIRVKNSLHEGFNIKNIENMKTTKENVEYHGFGIENIKRCVKKYDGELQYEYENKKIAANIILFHGAEEI